MIQKATNGTWMKWALKFMTALVLFGLGWYTTSVESKVDSAKVDQIANLTRVESHVDTNSRDISAVKEDIARIDANLGNLKADVETMQGDVRKTRESQIRQEGSFEDFRTEMTRWMQSLQNGHRDSGNGG